MTKTTDTKITQLNYVWTCRDIITNKDTKHLLQYFASCANASGTFFRTQSTISLETGLSERFVRKTTAHWKQLGIIKIKEANVSRGLCNEYQLVLSKLQSAVVTSQKEYKDKMEKRQHENRERVQRFRTKQNGVQELRHLISNKLEPAVTA